MKTIYRGRTYDQRGLASRNESDNALIQKRMMPLKKEFGAMNFLSARPANIKSTIDSQTNLLVFNTHTLNSSFKTSVFQWRSLGYLGPILALVKLPDPRVLNQFKDVRNVVLLEKPYDNKDLLGIAQKFLKDSQVNQRHYRRFETQQRALLESYQRDFTTNTMIYNISRGGAFIKGYLDDMSQGDLLRVNFELDELNKNHTMSAKVVWTSGKVGDTERAAGLQFISKEAIYNYLLDAI